MYTFNDWYEDKIEVAVYTPYESYLKPATPDDLVSMKKMSPETADKIKKLQAESFDQALEMNLERYKITSEAILKTSIDKQEYIEISFKELEEAKRMNIKAYKDSNYRKAYQDINGMTYRQIREKWIQFKQGKVIQYDLYIPIPLFAFSFDNKKPGIFINDKLMRPKLNMNFQMHLIRGKLQILKKLSNVRLKEKPYLTSKIVATYIVIRRFLRKDIQDRIPVSFYNEIKEIVGFKDRIEAIRTAVSRVNSYDREDRKHVKEELSKQIGGNNLTGFDLISSWPYGTEVVKYIKDNW